MREIYDINKENDIIKKETRIFDTYFKIISKYSSLSKSIIVFLMLVCFGMIFLQGIVLNLVCHFAMVIRVICVVKFREKGRQYM